MTGKSIRGALNYNERKVQEGQAHLIMASGFAADIDQLNFNQKLRRFEHLIQLNPRVKTNTLHISLNFDSSEQLSSLKLQRIAAAYMENIGFGEQPFLVYRHTDAAHQHVHIVTTSMQRDGKPIGLHNIGRLVSEPARKQIEAEFGLLRAESKQFKQHSGIKPADPEKANYGRIPTKRAISNIVTAVMHTYQYTSLAEFNAVLNEFNVKADRGAEDTEMFRKKGLIYSLLDRNGKAIGVPIKASAFYSKPTLVNLEKRFGKNAEKRKAYKEPLKAAINRVFKNYLEITRETFIDKMASLNVHVLFRVNEQGFTYGVTFVDHNTRTVFNGSDLGKNYSAKALSERFGLKDLQHKVEQKTFLKPAPQTNYLKQEQPAKSYLGLQGNSGLLKDLTESTRPEIAPNVSRKKKRRKKGLDQSLTF